MVLLRCLERDPVSTLLLGGSYQGLLEDSTRGWLHQGPLEDSSRGWLGGNWCHNRCPSLYRRGPSSLDVSGWSRGSAPHVLAQPSARAESYRGPSGGGRFWGPAQGLWTPTRSLSPRPSAELSIIKWTLKVKNFPINWTLEFGLSKDARCE